MRLPRASVETDDGKGNDQTGESDRKAGCRTGRDQTSRKARDQEGRGQARNQAGGSDQAREQTGRDAAGGRQAAAKPATRKRAATPERVMAIDIGGSHVKILTTGQQDKREVDSGPTLTPQQMVDDVKKLAQGWPYDVISIGYPGPVLHNKPVLDPANLGEGWCGFDFETAFGCPVKVVNDALMQAIGAYEGGRMLFLGLGTGLGSAMIVDNVAQPMELAHMPYKKGRTFEDYVGERGYEQARQEKMAQGRVRRRRAAQGGLAAGLCRDRRRQREAPEGDAARRAARQQRRCLSGRLQALGQEQRDALSASLDPVDGLLRESG